LLDAKRTDWKVTKTPLAETEEKWRLATDLYLNIEVEKL
jgi:hypothetical protein